jgi:hypothetical protein
MSHVLTIACATHSVTFIIVVIITVIVILVVIIERDIVKVRVKVMVGYVSRRPPCTPAK